MATSFKDLTQDDRRVTRTLLHESIPVTGTLLSGTYATSSAGREVNVKTFQHGMFQSVYDYPYASSSANHILDLTCGFSTAGSSLSASATTQVDKKVNIYNQMAQILAGYDTGSNIRRFDVDGELDAGTKHDNVIFMNFSRLLVKDEIKKGSFSMEIGTGSAYSAPFTVSKTIQDSAAASSYKINSPAGEYGLLQVTGTNVGLLYYQAGIAVLTSSVFGNENTFMNDAGDTMESLITGSTIDVVSDAIRHRVENISFNNTTELNSSIYFCRATAGEFNYSSNPTYIDQTTNKIRVKATGGSRESENSPVSYITTVGLYSHDNELLAVAKLSEPIKKTNASDLTLRVRLDY